MELTELIGYSLIKFAFLSWLMSFSLQQSLISALIAQTVSAQGRESQRREGTGWVVIDARPPSHLSIGQRRQKSLYLCRCLQVLV